MTLTDQHRLAEIRMNLEKHRAEGVDVSCWESEFFFKIIAELRKQISRQSE